MKIHTRLSEVTVSALPEDHIDYHLFQIVVQWRGGETYAVYRHRQCLSMTGDWDYEPLPSERDEAWIATHRFSYDAALALAAREAPNVVCNGRTAAEVAARITPDDLLDDPT